VPRIRFITISMFAAHHWQLALAIGVIVALLLR
jgi:hypothetical protein